MKLFLVQHALAKPATEDPERGLTLEGLAEMEKTAAFARGAGVKVEKILHSGKKRAEETAKVIAKHLTPGVEPEETDGLLPSDSPEVWAGRADRLEVYTMLVGHMPHLGGLAALLTAGDEKKDVVAFRNGCIVSLEKGEGEGWSVAWMITPGIIR